MFACVYCRSVLFSLHSSTRAIRLRWSPERSVAAQGTHGASNALEEEVRRLAELRRRGAPGAGAGGLPAAAPRLPPELAPPAPLAAAACAQHLRRPGPGRNGCHLRCVVPSSQRWCVG